VLAKPLVPASDNRSANTQISEDAQAAIAGEARGTDARVEGRDSSERREDEQADGEQQRRAAEEQDEQRRARDQQRISETGFTEEEQAKLAQLAARDREVRDHERAHSSVGGTLAGAPSFSYQRGPDGVNYAVGGEVSISVGTVANDPQATLEKAEQVRRAALAPADPSSQDRQVAARASQIAVEARNELASQRIQENGINESDDDEADGDEAGLGIDSNVSGLAALNSEADVGAPESSLASTVDVQRSSAAFTDSRGSQTDPVISAERIAEISQRFSAFSSDDNERQSQLDFSV
jgi:hypothetical protein